MFKKTLILVLVFNLHSELNLATIESFGVNLSWS